MKMHLKILILILVGVFLTSDPVTADQLHLENGDVITGEMIRMENKNWFSKPITRVRFPWIGKRL